MCVYINVCGLCRYVYMKCRPYICMPYHVCMHVCVMCCMCDVCATSGVFISRVAWTGLGRANFCACWTLSSSPYCSEAAIAGSGVGPRCLIVPPILAPLGLAGCGADLFLGPGQGYLGSRPVGSRAVPRHGGRMRGAKA